MPSSDEGVCGAVRYWLKLAIHRSSLLHAEKDRYKPITVLDYIDVNAAAYKVSSIRKLGKMIMLKYRLLKSSASCKCLRQILISPYRQTVLTKIRLILVSWN